MSFLNSCCWLLIISNHMYELFLWSKALLNLRPVPFESVFPADWAKNVRYIQFSSCLAIEWEKHTTCAGDMLYRNLIEPKKHSKSHINIFCSWFIKFFSWIKCFLLSMQVGSQKQFVIKSCSITISHCCVDTWSDNTPSTLSFFLNLPSQVLSGSSREHA